MKQMRRRRHLRPCPTRSQIHHRLRQLESALNLMQLEWVLEAGRPQPCGKRLRYLHDRVAEVRDEMAYVESM